MSWIELYPIRSEIQETLGSKRVCVGLYVLIVGYCGFLLWGICQEMPTALIFPARSETEQNQLESQIQDLVDYSGSNDHRITLIPIDSL